MTKRYFFNLGSSLVLFQVLIWTYVRWPDIMHSFLFLLKLKHLATLFGHENMTIFTWHLDFCFLEFLNFKHITFYGIVCFEFVGLVPILCRIYKIEWPRPESLDISLLPNSDFHSFSVLKLNSKCVTRILLLLSLIMAPACAKLDLLVMTPPGLFSHPLLDVPATRYNYFKNKNKKIIKFFCKEFNHLIFFLLEVLITFLTFEAFQVDCLKKCKESL